MMLYSAQYMTLAQKKKKVRYTLVYIYKYNFSITFVIGVKKQSWHGCFKEGSRQGILEVSYKGYDQLS